MLFNFADGKDERKEKYVLKLSKFCYYFRCPTSQEMRNKWLLLLKNKCTLLDWNRTKICSRHFENKYFDSQRRLSQYAVPTLFQQTVKIMKVFNYVYLLINLGIEYYGESNRSS